jgi:hypothetical protein
LRPDAEGGQKKERNCCGISSQTVDPKEASGPESAAKVCYALLRCCVDTK